MTPSKAAISVRISFGTVEAFLACVGKLGNLNALVEPTRDAAHFEKRNADYLKPSVEVEPKTNEINFKVGVDTAEATAALGELKAAADAAAVSIETATEGEKQKRKRRTKAQIEADEAAEKAATDMPPVVAPAVPEPAGTPIPPPPSPMAGIFAGIPGPLSAPSVPVVPVPVAPVAPMVAAPPAMPAAQPPLKAAVAPLVGATAPNQNPIVIKTRQEIYRYVAAKGEPALAPFLARWGMRYAKDIPLDKAAEIQAAIDAEIGPAKS